MRRGFHEAVLLGGLGRQGLFLGQVADDDFHARVVVGVELVTMRLGITNLCAPVHVAQCGVRGLRIKGAGQHVLLDRLRPILDGECSILPRTRECCREFGIIFTPTSQRFSIRESALPTNLRLSIAARYSRANLVRFRLVECHGANVGVLAALRKRQREKLRRSCST